ncbi:hypothetical protein O1M54_04205 [Streptomyces diastatochromogenes]|nr:hypothetical protein [Streptomyces diastatochromogenes]
MRTICDTLLDEAREGVPTAPGTAEVLPALRQVAASLDVPGPVRVTVTVDESALRAGCSPLCWSGSSARSSPTPCVTPVRP